MYPESASVKYEVTKCEFIVANKEDLSAMFVTASVPLLVFV